MLKIAVVGNNYDECKRFIQWKFHDKIDQVNVTKGQYILKNGDTLYMCFDEISRTRYNSMTFDAFVVSENYLSLLDIIQHRTSRPT